VVVSTENASSEKRHEEQKQEREFGIAFKADLVASCVAEPGESGEDVAIRAAQWLTATLATFVVQAASEGVFFRGDLDIGGKKAFLKGNNP
jgi:hypothetical protein